MSYTYPRIKCGAFKSERTAICFRVERNSLAHFASTNLFPLKTRARAHIHMHGIRERVYGTKENDDKDFFWWSCRCLQQNYLARLIVCFDDYPLLINSVERKMTFTSYQRERESCHGVPASTITTIAQL